MANRLNIVAIWIKQICSVVIGMILGAEFRLSMFNSTGSDASREECIDIRS